MSLTEQKAPVRRAKGERTRNRIIDATLRLIAADGLRGITHRSVAKEADVQLSLTTYYFKDIDDLIHQAFLRFSHEGRLIIEDVWQEVEEVVSKAKADGLTDTSSKKAMIETLVEASVEFILGNLESRREHLTIEQILFAETHQDVRLHELVDEYRARMSAPYTKICRFFNRKDPDIDGELILNTVLTFEYNSLKRAATEETIERYKALLRRQLGYLVGIKRN